MWDAAVTAGRGFAFEKVDEETSRTFLVYATLHSRTKIHRKDVDRKPQKNVWGRDGYGRARFRL